MLTSEELRRQRRELNRQIKENQRLERRQSAAEQRETARAEMPPERLEIENKLDRLAAEVFDNDNGRLFLEYLSDVRPVVADMIKERIERASRRSTEGAETGATKPPE